MSAPIRIFVLGLQRSGTTWLANQLAALDAIAAVEDLAHRGVHESVFFSHFARNFGDWNSAAARDAFRDAFAASDYFRLTGLATETLNEIIDSADSFGAVFVAVMDAMAARDGALGWVEKSPHHTLLSQDILAVAPDAKFLLVERDLPALVQSRLHGFGRTPNPKSLRYWVDVARGTVVGVLYRREMRSLARQGKGMPLRYEDLVADKGPLRDQILDYLGLPPGALESQYSANSSFEGKTRQSPGLALRLVVGFVAGLASLVPLKQLRDWQLKRDAQRGADWPEWVWTQTGYDPERASKTS